MSCGIIKTTCMMTIANKLGRGDCNENVLKCLYVNERGRYIGLTFNFDEVSILKFLGKPWIS